jgi:hypothetical protein
VLSKTMHKNVEPDDIPSLKICVAKTLCMFKMWFPPNFFNITKDFNICYPFERYLGVLKGYVWNKAKLEGCMTMGYMYNKTLEFCTKYLSLYTLAYMKENVGPKGGRKN